MISQPNKIEHLLLHPLIFRFYHNKTIRLFIFIFLGQTLFHFFIVNLLLQMVLHVQMSNF